MMGGAVIILVRWDASRNFK